MTSKRSAHTASFVLLLAIVGACGTPTSAPTRAPAVTAHGPQETSDGGADGDDEGNVIDSDGGVETSSELARGGDSSSPCPTNMVLVASGEMRFCIDKYEASLVEVDGDGNEKAYPHWLPVDGHAVRAVSQPDVFPQGFISEVQAEDACGASGKRLCSHAEWKTACMGPSKTTFPYGEARKPGVCHDIGKSAVAAVFGTRAFTDPVASSPQTRAAPTSGGTTAKHGGAHGGPGQKGSRRSGRQAHGASHGRMATASGGRAAETRKTRASRPGSSGAKTSTPSKKKGDRTDQTARGTKRMPAKASQRPASVEPSVWTQLNDPRLGQVDGALSKTGSHDACVNGYGALDMVGNIHEWVKTDPSAVHGTFAGGYYLDTALNGDGCQYRTTAHAHDYHDYSTGFRCCAEPRAPGETARRPD
jgi:hypothetical protein